MFAYFSSLQRKAKLIFMIEGITVTSLPFVQGFEEAFIRQDSLALIFSIYLIL
jgi:hypothetical protein